MWQYNYTDDYICHYGIKGMRWGVRRYQNEDGSLTPAGIKRYATKGYAEDAYKQNKSVAGKLYDKYTGAHKIAGSIKYDTSTKAENEKRAKEYLKSKSEKSSTRKIGPTGKMVVKGVAKAHSTVAKVQRMSANSVKKDIKSFEENREKLLTLTSRNGKKLFTESDIDDILSSLNDRYNSIEKKAKKHERFANSLLNELDALNRRV